MSRKTKIDLNEVLSELAEAAIDAAVDEAVDEAVDVAAEVVDAETEKTKPEPVQVIVTEGSVATTPKLSARTLAEMERGRRALAERNRS